MKKEKKLTFTGKNSKDYKEAINRLIKLVDKNNYHKGFYFCFIVVYNDDDETAKRKSEGGYSLTSKEKIIKLLKNEYNLFDDKRDKNFYTSVTISVEK